MTTRLHRIETKLSVLKPQSLDIIDESHLHANHYEGDMSEATHIKIKIRAESLAKLKMHEQHRTINKLLQDEFHSGLHALSIKILK